jgi:hypothetical protein
MLPPTLDHIHLIAVQRVEQVKCSQFTLHRCARPDDAASNLTRASLGVGSDIEQDVSP